MIEHITEAETTSEFKKAELSVVVKKDKSVSQEIFIYDNDDKVHAMFDILKEKNT